MMRRNAAMAGIAFIRALTARPLKLALIVALVGLGIAALPAQPAAAATANISFAANVLTITATTAETVRLAVAGTNLSIRSTAGTAANAGAIGLGFVAATGPGVDNTGSIAAANNVYRIVIVGSAG